MMSGAKKRVPKRRFKEFLNAGDWEQRKLSDISTKVTTKNVDIHYTETLTNSAEQGIISQVDFFDKEISNKDNINGYYIVENNDFIYNPRISTLAPVGPINRNKLNRTGIMSPLYTVFRASTVDLDFLEWYFQSSHWHRYMKLNGDSGARSDRIAIKDSTFFDMPIKTPVNIKEQVLIGETLEKFNQFIILHQRKLDKLQATKKALLQEMFPEEGQDKPKRRFKGFIDAWEQRKLSQITTRVTRKNGSQSDLPLTISAQDGLVDQRKYFNRQVASRDMSNYYLIKKGEFAYNKSYSEGYPFGAVKRLDYYDIGALSTLYILFEIADNNISSDFIVSYYMTQLWYKEISKRAAEGARNHGLLNISTEDFFDIELNIPNSIEEQVKIGNFIKQFDKFITLHQRKLDKLKNLKQAYLNEMFV